MEKWKIFRTACILILYFSLILSKPGWCDKQELNMTANCSRNSIEDLDYYTVLPFYMNLYNMELTSWFLMLTLIVYSLFLVDMKAKLIFRKKWRPASPT